MNLRPYVVCPFAYWFPFCYTGRGLGVCYILSAPETFGLLSALSDNQRTYKNAAILNAMPSIFPLLWHLLR